MNKNERYEQGVIFFSTGIPPIGFQNNISEGPQFHLCPKGELHGYSEGVLDLRGSSWTKPTGFCMAIGGQPPLDLPEKMLKDTGINLMNTYWSISD